MPRRDQRVRHQLKKRSGRGRSLGAVLLRTAGMAGARKFSGVTVSSSAAQKAERRVRAVTTAKRSALVARRSRVIKQHLDARSTLIADARARVQAIPRPKKSSLRPLLKHWAKLSKLAAEVKLVDGGIAGVRSKKHNENSWPTRFIVVTVKNSTLRSVRAAVTDAFQVPQGSLLRSFGIEVSTLFKKFRTKRYFVVTLRCPRRATRTSAQRIATGLQAASNFESVQLEGTSLRLQIDGAVDASSSVPTNTEWHLQQMRVREAWGLTPPAGGAQRGAGIVIGHPDSGWRSHQQYDQVSPRESEGHVDMARAYNAFHRTVGADAAIHDVTPQTMLSHVTHGTATGSVMVSTPANPGSTTVGVVPEQDEGIPLGDGVNVEITGVVPDATVLPVKCVTSVVLLGDTFVGDAIEYLVNEDVDVISISLGGVSHYTLQHLIQRAVAANIIVVCAAGQVNGVPDTTAHWYHNTVAEPAAYPETIAVAGTTVNDKPWAETFRGSSVDVSAPANHVWYATFDEAGNELIGYGSGTSYSAALVASAAALWLGFHGKQNLIDHYAGTDATLSEVFRHVVQASARRPHIFDRSFGFEVDEEWNRELFGAGIVDSHALLSEPLPAAEAVAPLVIQERSALSWISDWGEGADHLRDDIAQWGRDTTDAITQKARESAEFARNLAQVVGHTVSCAAESAANAAADALEQEWLGWTELAESAAGDLKEEAEGMAGALESEWEAAVDDAAEIAEEVAEQAEDAADAAVDVVEALVEDIDEGTTSTVDIVAETIASWLAP